MCLWCGKDKIDMYKPKHFIVDGHVRLRGFYPPGYSYVDAVRWAIAAWRFIIDNIEDVETAMSNSNDPICAKDGAGVCGGCPVKKLYGKGTPYCGELVYGKFSVAAHDGEHELAITHANAMIGVLREVLGKMGGEVVFMVWNGK